MTGPFREHGLSHWPRRWRCHAICMLRMTYLVEFSLRKYLLQRTKP